MTTDNTETASRRTALKTLAATAAAATVGGAGVILGTEPATAASVNISGASVSTDDGDVSYLDLAVSDYFATWNNFDVPVAAVAFRDVLVYVSGNGQKHVLYDQRGVDAQPVLLENISSKGDGSDGWGGPGEYASEDPSSYVAATGPTTAGFVHADVDWRLAHDSGEGYSAKSVEDPAIFGTDIPSIDVSTDGDTQTHTFEIRKQVYLYTLTDNGQPSITTEDGTTVYEMGADDGTRARIAAAPQFTVDVTNEASTSSTDGSGSTSGG